MDFSYDCSNHNHAFIFDKPTSVYDEPYTPIYIFHDVIEMDNGKIIFIIVNTLLNRFNIYIAYHLDYAKPLDIILDYIPETIESSMELFPNQSMPWEYYGF